MYFARHKTAISSALLANNQVHYCAHLERVASIQFTILDNDQLDTHLLYFTIRLLQPSTCFEHYTLIIRRFDCTDAASGIVTLSRWPSGALDGHLLRIPYATSGWFPGRKGSRCVGLKTLPPSCDVMKSGKLNFLEPSGPLQVCNRTTFPFYPELY